MPARTLRWLEAFLRRSVGRDLAADIAGDLEELRRHRATRSALGAKIWCAHAVMAIGAHAMWCALRGRVASARTAGFGLRGAGREVRQTVRSLRRTPWYSATVIGVIALAVALATTVFAVVDGVLFKPLPYPDANRLFAIQPGFTGLLPGRWTPAVNPADIANWSATVPDAHITAFRAQPWMGLGEGVNETPSGVAVVQPNFFATVGVYPFVGGFAASDFDHTTSLRPVIMTYDAWQGRFRGAADVVGKTIVSDPTGAFGFRIAGVMPRGFVFPSSRMAVRFLTPYVPSRDELLTPSHRSLVEVIARATRSMTAETLRQQVEAGMTTMAAAFPARGLKPPTTSERAWRTDGPFDHADVRPLAAEIGRAERPLFSAVFLAAVILLILGGLNVSGLMAARGLDRARELGLRRALGATGLRIAGLVFLEALVPISIGALLGLTLAVPLLHFGLTLLPEEFVLLKPQALDWRVAAFVAMGALALTVPATMWPIRRTLRIGATPVVDVGRSSTRSRSFGRTAIVVAQVAAALVLTVGGALVVSSILAVYSHAPAIRTDGVIVIDETMFGTGATMSKSPERTARVNAIVDRVRRVPGVDAVAVSGAQILRGGGNPSWFTPPPGAANARLLVRVVDVTSDFYRVVEPQLVLGRLPTDAELASDARVIVVSDAVARAYWPQSSPIGQTLLEVGWSSSSSTITERTPYAVVGVVKDVRWESWDEEIASIYGPYALLDHFAFPTMFIRTRGNIGRVTADAMRAIEQVDPLMRPSRASTLNDLFADSVRPRRFQSWLFGSFAVAALVIVGVGILGLIAMATARRTREMGIRLALGATRDDLVRLLLREQLLGVAAGVIIGSLVSAWAVRFVTVYLYEITAYDPRVWVAAITVIVLTAVAGTLIPSLRASRVDPVKALRTE